MGPFSDLPEVPGVDDVVDYVIELRKFRNEHGWVLVTSPKQNGTGCWEASWAGPDAHDDGAPAHDDGAPLHSLRHADLRTFLGSLKKQFGEA